MTNVDLFNFEFADREEEIKILSNFLSKEGDRVLWIYGRSGIGKSFFLETCLKNILKYPYIYVENKNNNKNGQCILELINKLQESSENKVLSFFRKHYKITKAITSDIQKKFEIIESDFIKYIMAKNVYFIDKNNNYNDFAAILKKYTDEVLSNKKLIIVIDNWDKCDENSVNILLNYVKSNFKMANRKFIFISTDNKVVNDNEKKLTKEIPCRNLPIGKIPNETYFINMLPHNFNIENLNDDDILQIYNYCKGFPEELNKLLFNLNRDGAINYSEYSISFDKNRLRDYLIRKNGDLDEDNMIEIDRLHPIQQCTILVIVCMGMPLRIDLLWNLVKFCYAKFFYLETTNDEINKLMTSLIPKPLKRTFDSTGQYIYTSHDQDYVSGLCYFKKRNIYPMACEYIYTFLHDVATDSLIRDFTNENMLEISADLSFNAQKYNWSNINLNCGNYFFDNQNYIQANKYFARLKNSILDFEEKYKLIIGMSFYEGGLYEDALFVLSKIQKEKINDKYIFYIYKGKACNMNNKNSLAAQFFYEATKYSKAQSNNQIYSKYLHHLALLQLKDHWDEAKEIYNGLISDFNLALDENDKDKIYMLSNARMLKACYNFYFNEEALRLMNMAEAICDYFGDKIEKAYITHNKGFELIRQNLVNDGRKAFVEAFDILINTKRHDAAYCLNNIGICQMIESDYIGAIDTFKKALFYQKSYYLYLTINTMLMQCYRLLDMKTQYEYFYDELNQIIESQIYQDPAIIRKISMNLAICECEDGNLYTAKYHLSLIEDIKDSSSEYRAIKLRQRYLGSIETLPKKSVFKKSEYFNNMNFEPWFITLSHD